MLIQNFKSKYIDGPVKITFTRYGVFQMDPALWRTALVLRDPCSNEHLCTASVNFPELPLDDGEMFLKGWSENAGVPEALVAAGVLSPAHRTFVSGFVQVGVHKLLIPVV